MIRERSKTRQYAANLVKYRENNSFP